MVMVDRQKAPVVEEPKGTRKTNTVRPREQARLEGVVEVADGMLTDQRSQASRFHGSRVDRWRRSGYSKVQWW